jgi:hypothetical protein
MKLTKKQLEQIGFKIITLSGGAKVIWLNTFDVDNPYIFRTRALSEKTLIKRTNEWLNEQIWYSEGIEFTFAKALAYLEEWPNAIFTSESGLKISYNVQSEELYRVK